MSEVDRLIKELQTILSDHFVVSSISVTRKLATEMTANYSHVYSDNKLMGVEVTVVEGIFKTRLGGYAEYAIYVETPKAEFHDLNSVASSDSPISGLVIPKVDPVAERCSTPECLAEEVRKLYGQLTATIAHNQEDYNRRNREIHRLNSLVTWIPVGRPPRDLGVYLTLRAYSPGRNIITRSRWDGECWFDAENDEVGELILDDVLMYVRIPPIELYPEEK